MRLSPLCAQSVMETLYPRTDGSHGRHIHTSMWAMTATAVKAIKLDIKILWNSFASFSDKPEDGPAGPAIQYSSSKWR
jgi:hypothetical protein